MPLYEQTLPAGQDFDGLSASTGALQFLFRGVVNESDDSKRAELFNVGVQFEPPGTGTIVVRLAKTRDDALVASGHQFLELLHAENVSGLQKLCCRCIVPLGYQLFIFTTEASPVPKYAVVDWHRVTVVGRA